jgi:DNA polymerase
LETNEILQDIARQISGCSKCTLSLTRNKSVPGEGPNDPEIMFIGEGPGQNENDQGRPFVGAAGKLLENLLQKAGLQRSSVFITNVVKCRPPNNRDPLPEELLACKSYLDAQVSTLQPLVIVTLGRFSMARFLPTARISSAHGQPVWINNTLIVPMYHPAAALHQPLLKPTLEGDFARLPEWIERARLIKNPPKAALPTQAHLPVEPEEKTNPAQETGDLDEPRQLSLF